MILIFDASVVVKLAVLEEGRDEVQALLADEGNVVLLPEWMLLEVASALWRKWRLDEINESQARDAIAHVLRSFQNLVPARDLTEHALKLAIELDHPSYDCAYIACALRSSGRLVTYDGRLISAATRGGHSAIIYPLGADA